MDRLETATLSVQRRMFATTNALAAGARLQWIGHGQEVTIVSVRCTVLGRLHVGAEQQPLVRIHRDVLVRSALETAAVLLLLLLLQQLLWPIDLLHRMLRPERVLVLLQRIVAEAEWLMRVVIAAVGIARIFHFGRRMLRCGLDHGVIALVRWEQRFDIGLVETLAVREMVCIR